MFYSIRKDPFYCKCNVGASLSAFDTTKYVFYVGVSHLKNICKHWNPYFQDNLKRISTYIYNKSIRSVKHPCQSSLSLPTRYRKSNIWYGSSFLLNSPHIKNIGISKCNENTCWSINLACLLACTHTHTHTLSFSLSIGTIEVLFSSILAIHVIIPLQFAIIYWFLY